jgi:hypothetical protein
VNGVKALFVRQSDRKEAGKTRSAVIGVRTPGGNVLLPLEFSSDFELSQK